MWTKKEEFLLQQKYPEFDASLLDPEAVKKMQTVQGITKEIRTIRAQFNVPPGLKIKALLSAKDEAELSVARQYEGYIKLMAKLDELQSGADLSKPKQTATATYGNIAIYVPLTGLIDFDKEKKRLETRYLRVRRPTSPRARRVWRRKTLSKTRRRNK